MATGAELGYNIDATALQMANAIFGNGVTLVGASYQGDYRSSEIYSNGDALAPDVTPSDSGVILFTGIVTNFTQSSSDPDRSTGTSTKTGGINDGSQFNARAGTRTNAASIPNVAFVPTGNVMTLQFVLSSEESPEYVNSQFNEILSLFPEIDSGTCAGYGPSARLALKVHETKVLMAHGVAA